MRSAIDLIRTTSPSMAASSDSTVTESRDGSAQAAASGLPVRIWREPEFWFVLLLVLGIYFTRPTTLTIRGEESRWANVAREMLETGDWVVPREQGVVFPNRPPLANWAIACSMLVFGDGEPLAVRFPSLLATLLTTLLIYTCGRSFLDRFGSLVAAAGYATMGQVLQIGRHAESEPLFTLFTAASLLGWLSCYVRGRAPWITWTVGYGMAALAALTKGPQGPIYFVASTWFYLLLYDRSFLLRRGHLIGIALFAAIIGAWQFPYYLATDLTASIRIWGGESANRFVVFDSAQAVAHAVKFSLEILNCTLPWSGLLLCLVDRKLRAQLGVISRPVRFLSWSVLLCLLPLLFAQAARGRYFMPLYPSIALLCGVAAQAAVAAQPSALGRRVWRGALGMSLVIPVAVTVYAAWQSSAWAERWPKLYNPAAAQSWLLVALVATAAVVMIRYCRRAMIDHDPVDSSRTAARAVCAAAIFYGFAFTSVGINSLDAYSYDNRADVRRAIAKIPADEKLVSFNIVNHLFSYHLNAVDPRHVELIDTPGVAAAAETDWKYFCYTVAAEEIYALPLPFAWEQVDVVTIDRNRYDRPRAYVVVGRKLPSNTAGHDSSPTLQTPPLEASLPVAKPR